MLADLGLSGIFRKVLSLTKEEAGSPTDCLRAYAEIDLSHLRHNLKEIQKRLPAGCKVMAVVKADAYGHGAVATATSLQKSGVASFAVAELNEAITLRKNGIKGEILILGCTPAKSKNLLIRYRLTQTIVSEEYARSLCGTAGTVQAHVKLDTGMNRLGIQTSDLAKLLSVYAQQRLRITGTYSHLARSDSLTEEDMRFTNAQIGHFLDTIETLTNLGIEVGRTHIQSSYGILNYPGLKCDYVRPGIALYGVLSRDREPVLTNVPLRPVMSLKARVTQVKKVNAGETVGYGQAHTMLRHGKIAVIGIGYADGIPRSLSGKDLKVLVKGQEVTLIGNICMDQMIVDITGAADIAHGDTVTLIGRDSAKVLSVNQISSLSDTINNDILSRIGSRVSKVYVH